MTIYFVFLFPFFFFHHPFLPQTLTMHRTAVENEAVFEETAASALHHNFHVDDLLKSTEDLDSAKQLVKTTKELLLLVPELQRRMGVKDQDLFGDLPK